MDKTNRQKGIKSRKVQNVLESLKDVGSSTFDSVKKDVIKPQEFLEQIFGTYHAQKKYSGEIPAGESIEMGDVFTGKQEQQEILKKQLQLERRLIEEERVRVEQKSNQLKIQLQAVIQEVTHLAQSTQELSKEVQIASMQAPVEPGVYHLIFFEKLLEFIKSFRKKVEEASVWLHATNKRAEKKNYWSTYKKHGAKFLLSADHYLTRSAG